MTDQTIAPAAEPPADADPRAALIDQYAAGPAAVIDALHGVTDDELDRRPAAGAWTAREIVHHLADSEAHSYVRLRMVLDQGAGYTVQPYDQDAFAADPLLGYDRPIDSSVAVLAAVRASSIELLRRLDDDGFARAGRHPEHEGPYGVRRWLEIYASHAHDHADQIRRARAGQI